MEMTEHWQTTTGFRLKPDGPVYWRTSCSCGWLGPMKRSERAAASMTHDHLEPDREQSNQAYVEGEED